MKMTFYHRSKTRLRFKLRHFPSLWASGVLLLLFSYLHICELSTHCSAQGRVGDGWVDFLPKERHYCRKGRVCLSPELCLLCRCSERIFVSMVSRWGSVLGKPGYKDVAFCSGLLEIAFLKAVILCFWYSLRLEHFFVPQRSSHHFVMFSFTGLWWLTYQQPATTAILPGSFRNSLSR